MGAYLKILRPKNLLIIAFTQFILYFFIIISFIGKPTLSPFLFSLLVLDTILIAAAGFVINDIFDHTYDVLNKPKKTFIPFIISLRQAKLYYWTLVLLGFLLASYIAFVSGNETLLVIYPIAVCTMYVYSYSWKNTVLIGNLIVSLFVAFVTGIVMVAERNSIIQMVDQRQKAIIIEIFVMYMLFSFFVNFIREIIKDIEDMEGDAAAQIRTLPIVFGIKYAKVASYILLLITLIILSSWSAMSTISIHLYASVFMMCGIYLPLILVGYLVFKADDSKKFSLISSILKWIMVAGLFSLILITSIK